MGRVDLKALAAKHAQINKQQEGGSGEDFLAKFFQVNEGNNTIRILPPKGDDGSFYAETKIHRVTDAEGNNKNIHCRQFISNEKCPLCEVEKSLWNKHRALKLPRGEKSDFGDAASAIKGRNRYYLNVLSRDTGEVKILSIGIMVFQKVLNTFMDEDFGDITDPDNGHDFKIVKRIVGQWPKYDESAARPKSSKLAPSKKEVDAILEQLHDIDALVVAPEYDVVREAADYLAGAFNLNLGMGDQATRELPDGETAPDSSENYLEQLNG